MIDLLCLLLSVQAEEFYKVYDPSGVVTKSGMTKYDAAVEMVKNAVGEVSNPCPMLACGLSRYTTDCAVNCWIQVSESRL